MTPMSIFMMIAAVVTVWGGLALAVVNLVRHPEVVDTEPESPPVEL